MENKKMTTPIVSVGADTEQSPMYGFGFCA